MIVFELPRTGRRLLESGCARSVAARVLAGLQFSPMPSSPEMRPEMQLELAPEMPRELEAQILEGRDELAQERQPRAEQAAERMHGLWPEPALRPPQELLHWVMWCRRRRHSCATVLAQLATFLLPAPH